MPAPEYNNDIDVNPVYAKNFPAIADLLVHKELVSKFNEFDQVARRSKLLMIRIGTTSLVLGFFAILGVITEMSAAGLGKKAPSWITVSTEMLGLLSILILLGDRCFLRTRARYRLACFKRERLRQWRFQLFLDGTFVESFSSKPSAMKAALSDRLNSFLETLRTDTGRLQSFIHSVASPARLLHSQTHYTNVPVADQVFDCLKVIRFEHQADFANRQITEQTDEAVLSLKEHYHWAETLGRFSLLGAFLIPVFHLAILPFLDASGHTKFTVGIGAVSLFLVAVSAAARAYRAGMTLPDELESYEDYLGHVENLRLQLDNARNHDERHQLLEELEIEAECELRRFLVMKGKATFVA